MPSCRLKQRPGGVLAPIADKAQCALVSPYTPAGLGLHQQSNALPPKELNSMNSDRSDTAEQLDHQHRLTFSVSPSVAAALTRAARAADRSAAAYVRRAVRAALAADGFEVSEIRYC